MNIALQSRLLAGKAAERRSMLRFELTAMGRHSA
ncbi:MAG: hypothetical protein QOI40_3274 [Alphaproteobacteria bacterium]|jgi:hypothetical protein|nr:hypothetical protein [Alphaproteobacteria bacterium]